MPIPVRTGGSAGTSPFDLGRDVPTEIQPDFPNSVFLGVSGCDATGKIGNASGIVLRRFLDNDGVLHLLHFLSRACLIMLVPAVAPLLKLAQKTRQTTARRLRIPRRRNQPLSRFGIKLPQTNLHPRVSCGPLRGSQLFRKPGEFGGGSFESEPGKDGEIVLNGDRRCHQPISYLAHGVAERAWHQVKLVGQKVVGV